MGSGFSDAAENRGVIAAEAAIHSPLLDDISIAGAKGILINVTGGEDMSLYDVSDATQAVQEAVGEHDDTNIIFGAVVDPAMNGKMQVTVIATGFNAKDRERKRDATPAAATRPSFSLVAGEARAEQTSLSLAATASAQPQPEQPRREEREKICVVSAPLPVVTQESAEVEIEDLAPVMHVAEASRGSAMHPAPGFDFPPPLLKKEKVMKEAQVFVHRGEVITHYQDDIDVPTFLRKQMQ